MNNKVFPSSSKSTKSSTISNSAVSSATQDSAITLRSMNNNNTNNNTNNNNNNKTIFSNNQATYHANLVSNEKKQFNILLHEYKDSLNETIQKQNGITSIPNFTSILKQQPEIQNSFNDPQLRMKHLNILIVLQNLKQLTQQTVHHTLFLFDSYCSKRVLYKRHYTLLFLTCFLVSCKYNDKKSKMPTIDELVKMANTKESLSPTTILNSSMFSSHNSNSKYGENTEQDDDVDEEIDTQMFYQMERHLLQTINWSLAFWSIEDSLQCICISLKQCLKQKLELPNHNTLGIKSNISLCEEDLLLLYQTASFLGEVSHTIPEFNSLSSDVIGYVSVLLGAKILETTGVTGVLALLLADEKEVMSNNLFNHNDESEPTTNHHQNIFHDSDIDIDVMMIQNDDEIMSPLKRAKDSMTPTSQYNTHNKLKQAPFPIKRLFTSREETIYKCLHLFLNLLFDIDTSSSSNNRRYNIFLQKYAQIEITALIETFQRMNNKAYYKLIYLTNLEENGDNAVVVDDNGNGITDSGLVREQIIHVSKYFLGFI
ncbi:hypothetical protein HANVADRAFT_49723 [Hanseniaspora valbyensis NRRL Y-1626]|uniref:Cyclin-like domain-containing protein n=1 Tax=Hanseniaspora valbyensis NRRL Y-1626 TaxID=766949 RepID=A0A1B7TAQ2_9ASCO|nr:hypothetical protein HANVADRAFT_49723 [Hanseniaspora valbyensis NRRL Y-1626]